MKKIEAGAWARDWVQAHVKDFPGLTGAYISGSYLSAPENTLWPESSDVDIVLIFREGCPQKIGKLRHHGLLLEVSCMEEREFRQTGHVLSTHYLAYAMNAGEILYDPRGELARLHQAVKEEYARRRWVDARCEDFYQRMEQGVRGYVPENMTLPQTVNGWAFTTAISCFPLLLANLENGTVRKRYTAARRVLETYGMESFYPRLLSLLVPEPLGARCLSRHMQELEKTFSLACNTTGPSAHYPFRQDISREGAPVAITGSWELIHSPHPEDAVFWMLATFARCHIIFDMDDPTLGADRLPALWDFLSALGIHQLSDFAPRLHALLDFLPALREAAGEIADRRQGLSAP